MGFEIGQYVKQIRGNAVGARGIVTKVGDGEVRVTYHGIRHPRVTYDFESADRFIEVIPKPTQLLASE